MKSVIFSKMGRSQSQSLKWLDIMMEEFAKEGDIERSIGMHPGKFNERKAVSQEKLGLAYIDLICRPFLGTYLILSENDISADILELGIDANRKHFENKSDNSK
eukprot:TRINITY_DN2241_c0_g1_i1.p9 TRINITY_DN2241_c0_g1~~TRINITY_DN2241_c0_g1_i1.p9  ORF type:complete len:104 (+),score=46.94 TRINITY_DN2241_c0_g1_i1:3059-3370(+)